MSYIVKKTFRDRQKGNEICYEGKTYKHEGVSQARLDYLQDRGCIAEKMEKPKEEPKPKAKAKPKAEE